MSAKKLSVASLLALGVVLVLVPQALAVSSAPAWKLSLNSQPTNFAPGASNTTEYTQYALLATNVGGAETSEPITLTDTLPEGVVPVGAGGADSAGSSILCSIAGQTVTCTDSEILRPGQWVFFTIRVDVKPLLEGSTLTNEAKVEGGGATVQTAATTTTISSASPPFGFLSGMDGLGASLSEEDGFPAIQAASHPYQFTADVGFPTSPAHSDQIAYLPPDGGLRDVRTYLPRGLLFDPTATQARCNEAQLESQSCPDTSVLGDIHLLTTPTGTAFGDFQSALYNMVPPPGAPAAVGFNAAGVGIFVHLIAGVRSDGSFEGFAFSSDVLARFANPVFGARVELWGDPSSPKHDYVRSDSCLYSSAADTCKVTQQNNPLLTLPASCSASLTMEAEADAWADPGIFRSTTAHLSDLTGDPVGTEGCVALGFEPTIKVRPTTNLTDSPSGLDVELHQPQSFDLKSRGTGELKDATFTFPAGLAVNAAQGDGLRACDPEQIGLSTPIGTTPIHFTKAPQSCPDAAKIGTVDVSSPLLAQYNAEDEALRDPETGAAIPEPLHGSVYIAKPFDNPFNSLIAVYLTVEDPKTGIIAKLAGKVSADPVSGQLSTRFEENPELPLEDVHVHLFGGARGGLITPPTCTTQSTNAELTPWSAPETSIAQLTDSFGPSAAPAGGPCPTSEGQMPNAPTLNAGTISPRAGAYSPLVFKLSRGDGSQRLAKLEATLPPGLSAKLAGVARCSEAQIAAARARSHPNDGVLEQASPSCPAASEVGVVTAGAGAGPTPLYTRGHAYLAGPYKGAPLSMVFITPALAGPFDLGAVVVRTAIYIDPTTAQGRAVSDPLPTVLDGIPLDLRSVALELSRPRFTFNPTSCNEEAFTAAATSILGQVAPLSQRFQAGGCKGLPYKPRYHVRLFGPVHRGGHPRLRAVFEARPGEANTARIVFALPHSEFIDQAHFRTICTRVQFAADECPSGSIYGHVKATSPQLDYTLEGPIYLRSSSHELPDVVLALNGPPSQPVQIDLDGRVDSVHGGVRTSFDAVPDAPVIKAIVTLQGGKKGLFENSTNICRSTHRASLKLDGQNGKTYDTRPLLKAGCSNAGNKKRGGRRP